LEKVNPTASSVAAQYYVPAVREFFDQQYRAHQRYWWCGENRYSLNPDAHTVFNARVLRLAAARGPGRALDLGAGEGADAIRLAKLGYEVDVVELSAVACEKIELFARIEQTRVNVRNESMLTAVLEPGVYDLVVMNGSLHYIQDKLATLTRVNRASSPTAAHALSLFSTATPLPTEHAVIPVFPDTEGGVVERFYDGWHIELLSYERDRTERSHPGFAAHAHSHIKLITTRPHDAQHD
jgi:SAM-dependent methyltransferase